MVEADTVMVVAVPLMTTAVKASINITSVEISPIDKVRVVGSVNVASMVFPANSMLLVTPSISVVVPKPSPCTVNSQVKPVATKLDVIPEMVITDCGPETLVDTVDPATLATEVSSRLNRAAAAAAVVNVKNFVSRICDRTVNILVELPYCTSSPNKRH